MNPTDGSNYPSLASLAEFGKYLVSNARVEHFSVPIIIGVLSFMGYVEFFTPSIPKTTASMSAVVQCSTFEGLHSYTTKKYMDSTSVIATCNDSSMIVKNFKKETYAKAD